MAHIPLDMIKTAAFHQLLIQRKVILDGSGNKSLSTKDGFSRKEINDAVISLIASGKATAEAGGESCL